MKTKLDHIYGSTGGASSTELEALKNQVTSLANVAAKTNISNVFTGNQTINGSILGSNGFYKQANEQRVSTLHLQGAKTISYWFIQNTSGFRNYNAFEIKFKYGNQNDNQALTLSKWEFQDTNSGLIWAIENNKLTFAQPTTIINVASPTDNTHAVNKSYVDSKVNGAWSLLQDQTLDFKNGNLQWQKTANFTTTGRYEFYIEIKNGNYNYIINETFNIEDLTKTYSSDLKWYQLGINTTNAVQAIPDGAICLFYNNKWIRIARYGNVDALPGTNTRVRIWYRQVV